MFDHCLYFNLASLSRQVTKIWNDEFALLGLSPSHGYLLMAIDANPKAKQKELREILELDPSTITRFIDALESKQLIERSGAGKGSEVRLTPQGRKIAKSAKRTGLALRDQMHTTLGEDVFKDVVGKLYQMKETLSDGRN